jgi:hypothetical protein
MVGRAPAGADVNECLSWITLDGDPAASKNATPKK